MSNEILSAQIESYEVKKKQLLRNIKFSLAKGELVVVIGRNGAGKSTFLKHLTNEIRHKLSEVRIFNKPINSFNDKELARVRAVLTQTTELSFDYDVLEVVSLGRIPHDDQFNNDLIARESLEKVGLSGYENRNYLSLSGGEKQRVHLARTLSQIHGNESDRIFLLDEPTNGLDIAHQYSTLKLLKELTSEGVGALVILHDLNLAAQFADKIIILKDGEISAYGNPREVLTEDNIFNSFGHKVIVGNHPTNDCPLIISNFK